MEQLGDLELGDGDEAGEELDLSKAKKKKKARSAAADAGAAASAAADGSAPPRGDDDDEDGDEDDGEGGEDDGEDGVDEAGDDGGITYEEDKVLNETWLGTDRDYTYRELLDRCVQGPGRGADERRGRG